MPQKSRYTNDDVEAVMNDVLLVLEKHETSKDMSLMVLGNVVSHILNNNFAPSQRKDFAQTFSTILQKTIVNE